MTTPYSVFLALFGLVLLSGCSTRHSELAKSPAIVAVEASGMKVFNSWDLNDNGVIDDSEVTELRVSAPHRVTNDSLAHVASFGRLSILDLSHTPRLTDAGLVHLKTLENLQELSLSGTEVSDAGLAHLSGLSSLKQLDLSKTRVVGEGLSHLRASQLERLYIHETAFTDEGMAALTAFTSLRALALNNKVTDVGLQELATLPNLELLFLQQPAVTKAGVEQLQKALPRCEIVHTESED